MTQTQVTRLQQKANKAVQAWRCAPHGHKVAARRAADKAVADALRAEVKAMKRKM